MFLEIIHGLAEPPLDQRGGDGDEQQDEHHKWGDQYERDRQAHQPQQDRRRREQRVDEGDGPLRGLPDDQAITRLEGVVLKERIRDGGELRHDLFADADPGLLTQQRRGGVARDDAQALDQQQRHQPNGRDLRGRGELDPAGGPSDRLQEPVQHQQEERKEERLGQRCEGADDEGARMAAIEQAQGRAQRDEARGHTPTGIGRLSRRGSI